VTSIQVGLYPEAEDFIVPVEIQIDENKILTPGRRVEELTLAELVRQGLRARLDLQSILTGQLRVELGFFPDTEAKYRGRKPRYPEIPSIPSTLETLKAALEEFPIEELAAATVRIVNGLDRLVNSPKIEQILDDVQQSAANVRSITGSFEKRAEPLAENIDITVKEINRLVAESRIIIDSVGGDLKLATADARVLMNDLQSNVDPAIGEFRGAVRSAQSAFDSADRAFKSADELIGKESTLRHEFLTLMKNLSEAARSLKIMVDYLERHPDALIRGKR
jgi:paraquat-inducible protein B